jgi:hypothetical protein
MRKVSYAGLALLLAAAPLAGAEGLANTKLTLKAGDTKLVQSPLSVKYDGPAPEGRIVVEEG